MNTGPKPTPPTPFIPPQVIQRDDGAYQVGHDDDAPGPFESRAFAESVATRQAVLR